MRTESITRQNGFTLIETMIAMAIFTIGILGLFGMQSAVIKENLSANTITTGSIWAADQVEQIIASDYTELLDKDIGGNNNGCAGLSANTDNTADDFRRYDNIPPTYSVYWNVARDCLLSDIPDADAAQEQKPLTVRIIVTKEIDLGGGKKKEEVAVFNYMKQNSAKKI